MSKEEGMAVSRTPLFSKPTAFVLVILVLLAAGAWSPGEALAANPVLITDLEVGGGSFNESKLLACDIDGDGREEILAGNMNGVMYCFNSDGSYKWQKNCGAPIKGGAACYDVDGDGKMEVFWGDMNGVVWGVTSTGENLSAWGWPRQTIVTAGFRGIWGTPAIGDINGDGMVDVVVGTWGHYIEAWSATGGALPGFPFNTEDTIWSSPALADIDNDGILDVIIGGDVTGGVNWPYPPGGILWVLKGNGTIIPGFPVCTPEVLWSAPAVADIDNDGQKEIVIGTGHYYTATGKLSTEGHRLYAFKANGSLCTGFPVVTRGCTMTAPAIADINNDGVKEIAITSYNVGSNGQNAVTLVRGTDGHVLWSKVTTGGPKRSSPIIADINSDGVPEIIVGSGIDIEAYDYSGSLVWHWNHGIGSSKYIMVSTFAAGVFDKDGKVKLAVGTGSDDTAGGYFLVFDCGMRNGSDQRTLPWRQFHYSEDRRGTILTGNEPRPPVNFQEYILVQNPNDEVANVIVQFMNDKGRLTTVERTVGARSRATIDVNAVLYKESISARVTSDQPLIVERPMYFNYKSAWNGGHDVIGATSTDTEFYFAEGCVRPNFDTYLCILNPEVTDAEVLITYMKGDSTTTTQSTTVEANSRKTISVKDFLGSADAPSHDFSCKVQSLSGTGIVVERPMYFNYDGRWTGGHDVMGALSAGPVWYFAEGTCRPNFTPYLCIQNPGTVPAEVRITYMKADGENREQTMTVDARSRKTVTVKDFLGSADAPSHDFSCKVETINATEIVVERPMYFDYNGWNGGHNVMGSQAAAPVYYFAEGTCRPNFTPYLCIQNPNESPVDVRITYMKGDGVNVTQDVVVGASSRKTVEVKGFLGEGNTDSFDFSCSVEAQGGMRIIVERPMYFNYGGRWTGGHDVVGATAPAYEWFFAEGYTGN